MRRVVEGAGVVVVVVVDVVERTFDVSPRPEVNLLVNVLRREPNLSNPNLLLLDESVVPSVVLPCVDSDCAVLAVSG